MYKSEGIDMTSIPALTQITDRVTAEFQGNTVASTVMLIIGMLIMIALCFAGYRAMRTFASITGLIVGWTIGYGAIVPGFNLQNEWTWAVPLILAIVVAALGFFFYRIGFACAIFFSVYHSLLPILSGTTMKAPFPMILAGAAGLILAVFGYKLFRSVIICATSYAGAFGFTGLLFDNLIHMGVGARETMIVRVVLGAAIGTIGVIYQFRDRR